MAQLTDSDLVKALTERLHAVHVEVTDMSGTFCCPSIRERRSPSNFLSPALVVPCFFFPVAHECESR